LNYVFFVLVWVSLSYTKHKHNNHLRMLLMYFLFLRFVLLWRVCVCVYLCVCGRVCVSVCVWPACFHYYHRLEYECFRFRFDSFIYKFFYNWQTTTAKAHWDVFVWESWCVCVVVLSFNIYILYKDDLEEPQRKP